MRTKVENKIRSNIIFKLMNDFQYNFIDQYTFYTAERYIWNPVNNITYGAIVYNIKPNRQHYNNVNKQSILNSLLKTGL